MRKMLSKFLVSTIAVMFTANISVSAATNSFKDKHEEESQYTDSSITLVSKELIDKADKYVNIKDGKYVLDNSVYKDLTLSTDEIREVELNIEETNKFLVESGNKVVNGQNKSFEIVFSNEEMNNAFKEAGADIENMVSPMAEAVGVNKVTSFWWGDYIYLDSYYTGLAITVSTAILAGVIGSLLPGIAGIAGAVAVAIVGYNLAFKYGDTGVVISWNTLLGFQDAWGQ